MIVGLDLGSKDFFESGPPYSNAELLKAVRRACSLGFDAVQIGALNNFEPIEAEWLSTVLDSLHVERNVHVGGLWDAERFSSTQTEYVQVRREMRYGVMLCREIRSTLVSIHPPFSMTGSTISEELRSRAKTRFLELLSEEVDYASRHHVNVAVESFCYSPFIFESLNDFAQFISKFPCEKLGVLLDMGHVYQMGMSLSETVHLFKDRLLEVHVHDATLEKDYQKATHLPIGKGSIDFPGFMDLLRLTQYDGWLTLEIRGSEKEILQSKEYIENLI